MSKKTTIAKVRSIAELRQLAQTDDRYRRLALAASANLGRETTDLHRAINWLLTNAQETSERGVVAEINFVRDTVEV